MTRIRNASLAGAFALVLAPTAGAVMVLESTHAESGWAAAHELASKAPFTLVIDISPADPEVDQRASGVWIGNDDKHGYILTAAHNFCETKVEDVVFLNTLPVKLEAESVTMNPAYICGSFSRMGYDMAIVTLKEPMDIANMGVEQPTLYDGENEYNKLLTFVGYGVLGTGKQGYVQGSESDAAAAQEVVYQVAAPADPMPGPDDNAGNFLVTFFPAEEGTMNESSGEVHKPVSKYSGLPATGDSGGPAFIEIDGKWYLAATNQSGTGDTYGSDGQYARTAGNKDWILSVFPSAKFGHEAAGSGEADPGDEEEPEAEPQ